MRIYCPHAASFDFKNEWYAPLRELEADGHTLIFPHENDEFADTKELIRTGVDLVLAEVSYPSTGLGIELGWADAFDVPRLLYCKKEVTPSWSLAALHCETCYYDTTEGLLSDLRWTLRSYVPDAE